jgi:ABC-type spermidine/putrescine transport system permease subunit II
VHSTITAQLSGTICSDASLPVAEPLSVEQITEFKLAEPGER